MMAASLEALVGEFRALTGSTTPAQKESNIDEGTAPSPDSVAMIDHLANG